jgi:pyruvate formate lyase activating enzyme
MQQLPVFALTPFTMLDFPEHTAAVIWFAGCNLRCAYCHNPQIVRSKGSIDMREVMAFLRKRRGLLDGVVLSGGEASIYPNLQEVVSEIKKMGYAVKLDTNGLRPEVVEDLIQRNLLDYIALDYKAPAHKFKAVTGMDKYHIFSKTLDMLCKQNKVSFEVRTTVHTDLLDEEDMKQIIDDLDKRGFQGNFYVQNFRTAADAATLKRLQNQETVLNIASLPEPENFTLAFRNF